MHRNQNETFSYYWYTTHIHTHFLAMKSFENEKINSEAIDSFSVCLPTVDRRNWNDWAECTIKLIWLHASRGCENFEVNFSEISEMNWLVAWVEAFNRNLVVLFTHILTAVVGRKLVSFLYDSVVDSLIDSIFSRLTCSSVWLKPIYVMQNSNMKKHRID